MKLTVETIAQTLTEVFRRGRFHVSESLTLEWLHVPEETTPWEVFRGRLIEPAHCCEERRFRSWNVFVHDGGQRAAEPLLSLKWDADANLIHVTRGMLAYVWEGYDAGDNVILSREVTRWTRELVGTIALADTTEVADLRRECGSLLFHAVVGTSRLPLTSLEAPLPQFTLGQLGYFSADPLHRSQIDGRQRELVKWLELLLRQEPFDMPAFIARWQESGRSLEEIVPLLRDVFNEVSLSPYTGFVDNTLAFVRQLVEPGHLSVESRVDFLGYILRQLGRHLTAYDLVTFHYRGANYPDALLLDAVLREYVSLIGSHSELFRGDQRLRRRALRQACIMRQYYQDLPVPDAPTSPGENARVMPAPFERVPEEQILQSTRRRRQLYANDPLPSLLSEAARTVLRQSIADLQHPAETRELGIAIFIDRPLGANKLPGEPDQTPLLAHAAFSRSIAVRRAAELRKMSASLGIDISPSPSGGEGNGVRGAGLPMHEIWSPERPAVSLADARRVADDFVLLQTMPSSVKRFASLFDFRPLAAVTPLDFMDSGKAIIVPTAAGMLTIYDSDLRKRVKLEIDVQAGFRTRCGVELPANGLRVVRVWNEPLALGAGLLTPPPGIVLHPR